jgi:hypothetical protein
VPLSPGGLSIFVSQSGETADTLAMLRYAKEHKQHALAVVNVSTTTIARESHAVMPTLAGPEIGVASTKAFTCQLAVLACRSRWSDRMFANGIGRLAVNWYASKACAPMPAWLTMVCRSLKRGCLPAQPKSFRNRVLHGRLIQFGEAD